MISREGVSAAIIVAIVSLIIQELPELQIHVESGTLKIIAVLVIICLVGVVGWLI